MLIQCAVAQRGLVLAWIVNYQSCSFVFSSGKLKVLDLKKKNVWLGQAHYP